MKMVTGLCVLVCVCYILVVVQGENNIYTVDPEGSANNCFDNKIRCSLMYYATHCEKIFYENNTTFIFLPGDHQLSIRVNWRNASNLKVYMNNSSSAIEAKVMCRGENTGGFSFYNIINLTIENLSFINCSTHGTHERLIAVEIVQTSHLIMFNVNIQNTSGYGLFMIDIYGVSKITNITIDSSHNTKSHYGGNFAYNCSNNFTLQNTSLQNHSLYVTKSYFRDGCNALGYKSPASGILVSVSCSATINITFDHVHVTGNTAKSGGNVWIEYYVYISTWTVSISFSNSELSNGIAQNAGGGLFFAAWAGCANCTSHSENSSTILAIENIKFENNSAWYSGAAVYLRLHQNPKVEIAKIEFTNNSFTNNRLAFQQDNYNAHGGVGVHIITYTLPEYKQHETVFFEVSFSKCIFQYNHITYANEDPISVRQTGALYTEISRSITIRDCSFIDNECTGIVSLGSNLLLHGQNKIHNNTGVKGGGMFFCAGGLMHLYNGSKLIISNNHANLSGGGIYVDGECSPAVSYCFFQVDNVTADNVTLKKTQVYLDSNIARSAGNAIYGGLIDNCVLFDKHGQQYQQNFSSKIFNFTFQPNFTQGDLTYISSDPLYVGFCTINSSTIPLNTDNCPLNTNATVMPGGSVTVHAVLMGQRYGLVSGLVIAWYKCNSQNCKFDKDHYSQSVNASTYGSDLTYSIYPASADTLNVTLVLVAEDYYWGFPSYTYKPSHIIITIEDCPLGFKKEKKSTNQYYCSCMANIQCNITEKTLLRKKPYWIGYMKDHYNDTTDIIHHAYCPLDYCVDKDLFIKTTLNGSCLNELFDQDVQCSHNRTGLLCGACKPGYSLGFGSSQCLPHCNTRDIAIHYVRVIGLIIVCGVAGVMLVVLLTLLNLTVAEGTLNGLIFYANIIQVNSNIFFPPETHARPWTAFIAWLNLDFGFTVCFYDGMDAYAKTWLQFIFPLYIWLISGAIVYYSWKYNRVAKLLGKNAIKVLATLFLLSFGKLIRTVIATAVNTKVHTFNEHIKISVWLLDANIHYLHGKHIILFIISALVGSIAVLYAVILTSIQCLRRAPNNRMCSWVQRLKPLLDAYTGPYKDKYHFWTGLLLLVRIFLFLSFALNYRNDPTINFTHIIIITTVLMIAIQPGIYQNQFVGLLEGSMYVNLILFSVIMMSLVGCHTYHKTIAAYVFGGWALLTFLGIIAFHAHKYLFGFVDFGQMKIMFKEKLYVCVRRRRAVIQPLLIAQQVIDESEESAVEDDLEEREREMTNPTWQEPELREPLIGSSH